MLVNMELHKKLKDALESGRYFITITEVKDKELKHFHITSKFPKEDILPTLEHFAKQLQLEVLLAEDNT